MAPPDDKVNFTENASTENSRPIRVGDTTISCPHICAFFNNHDDDRVLLPFIKDGLERGEKAVQTLDPARCDEHLEWLGKTGIDVTAARESGRFELRTWTDTHLRWGQFDQHQTLALFGAIVKNSVLPDEFLRELRERPGSG